MSKFLEDEESLWPREPVGFSPEALLNGAGDGYYCFINNQPLVLEDMGMRPGVDFFVTRPEQLGYKVPSTLMFVERQTLHARRAELVGFLRARLVLLTVDLASMERLSRQYGVLMERFERAIA